MKKIFQLAVIMLTSTMFLTACSNSNDPEGVAKSFIKAMNNNDFKGAASYCDDNTAKLFTSLDELSKLGGADAKKDKSNYEFVKSETKGDKATVTFKDSKKGEFPVTLVKVDGKWKVSMGKENLGGGSTATPQVSDMPSPTDSLAPSTTDTSNIK